MPTLAGINGASLVPDILGSYHRGAQLGLQTQSAGLGVQQQQQNLEAGQQAMAANQALGQQQQQSQALQRQILGGQPGPEQPLSEQEFNKKMAELIIKFPNDAKTVREALHDTEEKDEKKREAQVRQSLDFLFELQNTPDEQRPEKLKAQRDLLISQDRNPVKIDRLSQMNLNDQDFYIRYGLLAGMTPKERHEITKGKPLKEVMAEEKAKAAEKPEAQVQSSQIMAGGLVQLVMKDGEVKLVEPSEANELLIKAAEDRASELQGERAGERGAATAGIKVATEAFQTLGKVRKSIRNIDEGIKLIDEGAKTGAIEGRLPSIRTASVKLKNLQDRMGLDIVGMTSFGALSESELEFALRVALPTDLDEIQLRQWLVDKRNAQHKVAANLEEAALFLGEPGNTIAEFIKMKKDKPLSAEEQEELNQLKAKLSK